MISPYPILAIVSVAVILLLVQIAVNRLQRRSVAYLPGPKSPSWWVGNLRALLCSEVAGEMEVEWTRQYGTAVHLKGSMGIDMMLISDPKALQYILNTSGYNYPRPQQSSATARIINGQGILYTNGSQHARQRKLLNPAFSYGTLKTFLPIFRHASAQTCTKWKEIIVQAGGSTSLDMSSWLARTTLDALGEAAFDYRFGAIEEARNPLSDVYSDLVTKIFYNRSNFTIVFEALWGYLPFWIVKMLQAYPTKQRRNLHKYSKVARGVAKDIISRQIDSHARGKEGGKDVMSILIKANIAEDPKSRMSEEEILGQLTTLMLAGHETTASTVTWALYELAKNTEFQKLVREEIKATRADAEQRGDKELSIADLDTMLHLSALVKETLRLHPIATFIHREAGREDVIPLSIPVTTKSEEVITTIPVGKGQRIIISIAAYNRLKTVWGEDADIFRPERFLENEKGNPKTTLGVFANLASFSSGLRSCIGVIEMQVLLVDFLEKFEFSPAPGSPEVIPTFAGLLATPMLANEPGHTQLPLTVSLVA